MFYLQEHVGKDKACLSHCYRHGSHAFINTEFSRRTENGMIPGILNCGDGSDV